MAQEQASPILSLFFSSVQAWLGAARAHALHQVATQLQVGEGRSWPAMVLTNMILQAPEQFSPPLFPVMHSLGVSACPGGKAFWRCLRAAWKQGLLCESRCASLRRCSIGRACASESGHCAEKQGIPCFSQDIWVLGPGFSKFTAVGNC